MEVMANLEDLPKFCVLSFERIDDPPEPLPPVCGP